jgi:hypothetical protein
METGLKLLCLKKLFKKKTGSKGSPSNGKLLHNEKDNIEIDNMVFSDSSEDDLLNDIP